MATENLTIFINEKGALVVERNIANIGKAAKGSVSPVQLLQRALAGLGLLLLGKQILGLADSFQVLQNKLRVVTDGQQELVDVTRSLFAISQSTRSSFESSVELYSRLSLSAKELGLTQKQVLGFTESLNQAVAISGATAQEAEAAIRQLSQGIASGALRGDELRSVLENLPTVADVIAKSLGVTRGELRELGQQGKITAEDIIIAFQEARVELNDRFGKTVPTIGQALTKVRNALLQAADADLSPLTDALSNLADTISDPNFQQSFALFVSGIVKLVGLAVEGAAQFANFGRELGFFAAKVTGNVSELDDLQHQLDFINKGLKNNFIGAPLDEGGRKFFEQRANEIEAEIKRINDSYGTMPEVKPPTAETPVETLTRRAPAGGGTDPKELEKQQSFIQGLRDQAAELTYQVTLGDDAAAAISRYNLAIELAAQEATPALVAQATELNEAIITLNAQLKAQEETQKRLAEQNDFVTALEEQSAQLQFQTEAADFTANSLQRYQLITQAAALGDAAFVAQATEKIDALLAQQKIAAEMQKEQEDATRIIEQNITPQEDFNHQLDRAIELYGKGKLTATEYSREVLRLQEELVNATDDLDPALENMNTFLKRARENAQDILGNTLADLFTEGLDDVPSKFADMLKQLAAQYLASEIFRVLGSATKSAAGGSGGGFLSMLSGFFAGGFAGGGSFTVPGQGGLDSQMAMMKVSPGEKVTVQTPQQQRNGTGSPASAPPQVNVSPNIVVTLNPDDVRAAMQGSQGQSIILSAIRDNPGVVRESIQ